MKAIFFDSPGGSDVLRYGEAEKPETNGGEVLIKVAYAGVNRADILQRMGHYDPPPGASPLLGLEVSGTIEETGEKVCALLEGGGYAEYARVRRTQCLHIPNGLSLEQAAALPEAVFTVWKNIYSIGFLRRGETALIHGGASGIGTMAIQMIKAFGGNVIVTAGNDLKCRACKKLGADLAINYKTQDFVPLVSDFTGGKGVNVVLDMVGGDYVARNIDCLAKYGRHVSIAYPGGAKATISIPKIMQKQLILTGSTLRAAPFHEKEDLADGIKEHVWPLIASGKIKPVIHKVFPLKDAAKAHEMLEKGENTGKLVLKI